MKTINIFGKTISATALALILIAGIGSAALLTYYGTITATVNVQQSILLDGLSWPNSQVTDTISEPAPGGEKFCFEHTLTNQMSVRGTVDFDSSCSPDCSGITKEYRDLFSKKTFDSIGDVHAKITKENLSEYVLWTFNITDIAPHYGVGLVISTESTNPIPAYQIYFAEWGDKNWHYQDYGSDLGGVYCGWETGVDVVCAGGICANGIVATGNENGNIFTIKIPKSKLGHSGADFGWASQVRTTLLGKYPNWTPWCGFVWVTESTVGSSLTPPISIPSKTTKDFYICYDFAQNIAPTTYTIVTAIKPA